MSNRGERNAVISGVGQSQIGRRIYRDPLDLTIEATFDALDDAGLTVKDIDGISTYPGNMSVPPGFSGVGVTELQEALHLELEWFSGGVESPGQFGSVINAIAAVSIGLCRHVVCFRTVWEASAQGDQGRASVTVGGGGGSYRADGFQQWTLPFGAASAANWIGMMAQRHFHEFGTTREQLAQIALNARKNAALNPKAIYRDPMTMDDYLHVRMVSEPLCLYDCDVPADGSTVVIVSAAETAGDLRRAAGQDRGRGLGTARSQLLGPVRRPHHHGRTRRREDDVGAVGPDARPTSTSSSSTTASASSPCAGWRPSGFCAHGEGGAVHRGRPAHRPGWRAAAQHPRWSALGRPAARLRVPARGVHPALGRGGGASGRR